MTDLSATNVVTDRLSGAGIADRPATVQQSSGEKAYEPIRDFLDQQAPATPCVAIDLATVRRRYDELKATLPSARIHYAVKANPEPGIITELIERDASFDVASPGEIDLCLRRGAGAESISYGNTIKKSADIARAYALGVRLFATDSENDLENIAAAAPGSRVFCRVAVDNTGSRTPFGRKFGCDPDTAVKLLCKARDLGLEAYGVSFHIGSQQLDPTSWEIGIAVAAEVARGLAEHGIKLPMVNLGGGLPATYTQHTPTLTEYAESIGHALRRHFGGQQPELFIEPGRHLVGDAGVLRSEVVLVTPETGADRRWIYLDVGRYNGLAETEGEAITYRLRTPRDGDLTGPVVLAGPTCDGDDVLYEHTRYELPLSLRGGDSVDVLSAGAYTTSYSSIGFNGFEPLTSYCFDSDELVERA